MNGTELETLAKEVMTLCEWMKKSWDPMCGKAGGEKRQLLERWGRTLCAVSFADASDALQESLDFQEPLDLKTWAPKIRDRGFRIANERSKAEAARAEEKRHKAPSETRSPDTRPYERMRKTDPRRFAREMECKRAAIRKGRAAGCGMRAAEALLRALGEDPDKPESEEARKERSAREASKYRHGFDPSRQRRER